jgi:hypothetical protein
MNSPTQSNACAASFVQPPRAGLAHPSLKPTAIIVVSPPPGTPPRCGVPLLCWGGRKRVVRCVCVPRWRRAAFVTHARGSGNHTFKRPDHKHARAGLCTPPSPPKRARRETVTRIRRRPTLPPPHGSSRSPTLPRRNLFNAYRATHKLDSPPGDPPASSYSSTARADQEAPTRMTPQPVTEQQSTSASSIEPLTTATTTAAGYHATRISVELHVCFRLLRAAGTGDDLLAGL